MGGVACTIQTVEELTNIRIDDAIVVDFNGFKDMVDAVNGVEVCIPKDVSDPAHDIYFEAGTQRSRASRHSTTCASGRSCRSPATSGG